MAKKKKVAEKKVTKKIAAPKSKVSDKEAAIAKIRDGLISQLESKLLTNSQLKSGGPAVRARHMQEKGYDAVITEINSLGAKIGISAIKGIGHLRRG